VQSGESSSDHPTKLEAISLPRCGTEMKMTVPHVGSWLPVKDAIDLDAVGLRSLAMPSASHKHGIPNIPPRVVMSVVPSNPPMMAR